MSLTNAIPNIYEVREILKKCWKSNPCEGSSRPSGGQCLATAVLIRELFGGEIMMGIIGEDRHYWNRLNGIEVDLTSDQYGGDGYRPLRGLVGKVSRAKGTSNKRYKMLRKCWDVHEKDAFIW